MSGIAGIWQDENKTTPDVVDNMMHHMLHRGPDAHYTYDDEEITLLYSSLSLVSTSQDKQPCIIQQGLTYSLIFNGELYNAKELKAELCQLGHDCKEASDTEILLYAFIEWKEECLSKLNGMFAFAVWIKELHHLFLARDPMGVKPLFYVKKSHLFLFASEIKTLLAHPQVSHDINKRGVMDILMLGPGRTPGYGVFEDIRELKPGQYALFEHAHMKVVTYYHLEDRPFLYNFQQTKQMTRLFVEDAIQRQLQAEVEVATFLSGGLDSSIICAIAADYYRKRGKQLETFSVTYEENDRYFHPTKFQPNDDSHYIDVMQKFLGSKHHAIVLKTTDLLNALYEAVDARDLPGMADIDSSMLLFCKEVRKHTRVALLGECADELFGGYPWYHDPALHKKQSFPWAQSNAYRASFINKEILAEVDPLAYVKQRYQMTLKECDYLATLTPEEKQYREMMNLNVKWFMQTLLDRQDRMGMYSGLEVRVPYCDMRIADYLYSVPWHFKNYKGYEKGLLREAMKGEIPDEILWRKKSPYPKTWHPKYREMVNKQLIDLLHQSNEPIFNIVKKDRLKALLKEEQDIPWYGQLMNTPQTIAYMLQVNYWMKKYQVGIHI